jgi:hypothetical protein
VMEQILTNIHNRTSYNKSWENISTSFWVWYWLYSPFGW